MGHTELIARFELNGHDCWVLWKPTACYLRVDGRFFGNSLGEDLSPEDCEVLARVHAQTFMEWERSREVALLPKLYQEPHSPQIAAIRKDYHLLVLEWLGQARPVVLGFNHNVYVCLESGWHHAGLAVTESEALERAQAFLDSQKNTGPSVGCAGEKPSPSTKRECHFHMAEALRSGRIPEARSWAEVGLGLENEAGENLDLAFLAMLVTSAPTPHGVPAPKFWGQATVLAARLEHQWHPPTAAALLQTLLRIGKGLKGAAGMAFHRQIMELLNRHPVDGRLRETGSDADRRLVRRLEAWLRAAAETSDANRSCICRYSLLILHSLVSKAANLEDLAARVASYPENRHHEGNVIEDMQLFIAPHSTLAALREAMDCAAERGGGWNNLAEIAEDAERHAWGSGYYDKPPIEARPARDDGPIADPLVQKYRVPFFWMVVILIAIAIGDAWKEPMTLFGTVAGRTLIVLFLGLVFGLAILFLFELGLLAACLPLIIMDSLFGRLFSNPTLHRIRRRKKQILDRIFDKSSSTFWRIGYPAGLGSAALMGLYHWTHLPLPDPGTLLKGVLVAYPLVVIFGLCALVVAISYMFLTGVRIIWNRIFGEKR